MGTLEVSVVWENDLPLVVLCGEVDYATAYELRKQLEQLIQQAPKKIELDMEEVTFMDSEGIRTILVSDIELKRRGGSITIRRCSRIVHRTFSVLGLDRYLECCIQQT